jgi:hypothetical protein
MAFPLAALCPSAPHACCHGAGETAFCTSRREEEGILAGGQGDCQGGGQREKEMLMLTVWRPAERQERR